MANPIIGIDLGTTNCAVTKYERGKTTVLPIKGKLTTPSVLYIEGNTVKVGHDAKKYMAVHPEKCLASTKRDMGTTTVYNIGGKEITPVLAASLILKYLKEETEAYLNEVCNDVVITIPAYFGFNQRNATEQAAISAGWNLIQLLAEPTAAAIIYGQNRNRSSLYTVVDLGGGTFDVTVLEQRIDENGEAIFDPLKVGGDDRLGGDDFDNAIVRYMIDEGASGYKSELELKEEAEKAKIALSTSDVVGISCQYVDTTLTRDDYKKLISPYLDKICNIIKKTVFEAGKSLEDIDRFILVGGSCKHPIIKDAIRECIGREPYSADNLDTAVSEGAALRHHFLRQLGGGQDRVITKCPKYLGTDVVFDGESINVIMVEEGETLPRKACQLAYYGGSALHTKVLEGNARLTSECKELYEMVVNMITPGESHAIVTIFDIDISGCLTFFTYEIKAGCDIDLLRKAADEKTLKFDYKVWEEFKRTHSSSEYFETKDKVPFK